MLAALSPLRDRSNDAASRTPVGKGSASKPSRLGLTPAAATPKSAGPARSPLGAVDVNSASKGTPTVRGTPINAKENPRLAAKAAKPSKDDDKGEKIIKSIKKDTPDQKIAKKGFVSQIEIAKGKKSK